MAKTTATAISLARHCQTHPAELIISCGQHSHVSDAVQIATATQLCSYCTVILMYAQSSSIATASSLWCELSDQVQCV